MNEVADFVKNFAGASKDQHNEINDFLSKKHELISNNVSSYHDDTIIAGREPEAD